MSVAYRANSITNEPGSIIKKGERKLGLVSENGKDVEYVFVPSRETPFETWVPRQRVIRVAYREELDAWTSIEKQFKQAVAQQHRFMIAVAIIVMLIALVLSSVYPSAEGYILGGAALLPFIGWIIYEKNSSSPWNKLWEEYEQKKIAFLRDYGSPPWDEVGGPDNHQSKYILLLKGADL